jgi:hypothetical protein
MGIMVRRSILLKKLFVVIFTLFIFSVAPYLVLRGSHSISLIENRTLAQKPVFSLDNVISGKYMSNYDKYLADQFPGRNVWLKSYLKYEIFTNKTFVNNYYVSENNWIVPRPTTNFPKNDMDVTLQHLNHLNQVVQKSGAKLIYVSFPFKVNYVNVSKPSYIMEDQGLKYKQYFLDGIQKLNISIMDIGSRFKKEFSQNEINSMYFKTDHHWNMKGAFAAYKILAENLGVTISDNDYIRTCENNVIFTGTYNVQLYMTVSTKNENVCYMNPKNFSFDHMSISVNDKKTTWEDVYGSFKKQHLTKVNYNQAYTDNYANIHIVNPQPLLNKKVLISKDSYTNAMLPHLAKLFREIDVIDLRFYKKGSFEDLVRENKYDYVLIMHNNQYISGPLFNYTLGD